MAQVNLEESKISGAVIMARDRQGNVTPTVYIKHHAIIISWNGGVQLKF